MYYRKYRLVFTASGGAGGNTSRTFLKAPFLFKQENPK
jgi:hypothetical protein